MEKPVKILILGNGFGGIYTLRTLREIYGKNRKIEISLIGEKNYFLFTPLLHEVATGGVNPQNIIEPIRDIFKDCLSNFYLGKAEEISILNKNVKIDGNLIPYDFLVLAPGSETNFYNIEGAEANTLTLKSIEDAIKIKSQIITKVECASRTDDKEKRKKKLRFVVIGGGPTGVELAAELQEFISETFSKYYAKELIDDISIYLVDRGSELVSTFSKKIREESLRVLKQKGIKVVLNASVKKINPSEIVLADDTTIQTETIIWVAGIKPRDLTFDTPIERSANGKILINKYLQILGHENIFAIGDAAGVAENPNALPALAQAAEQESEYVAKNIKFILENKPLKEFKYKSAGTLMSLGRWMAVGELFGITFSGAFAWWVWRTVYLSKLISFKKKIKVALDWSINIFSSRDISQI